MGIAVHGNSPAPLHGDTFPVTPAGRGIAAFLMVAGIALFGVLTANVAAFFVEQQQGGDDEVKDRLDEILRRLDQLELASRAEAVKEE